MIVSFVVWDGRIGGAERQSVALAAEFRRQGVESGLVFVGGHDQLRNQIEDASIPAHHLALSRGRSVVLHPRRLATAVRAQGAEAAVVAGFGYLGTTLRLGGFRGPLIGVEHGDRSRALARSLDRALAVLAHDAEVSISAYMESLTRQTIHSRTLLRIPHGVSLPQPALAPPQLDARALRIGYAGRLYPGKGVDILLRAVASCVQQGPPMRLSVAGDGPARPALIGLATRLGIGAHVEFNGWIDDISSFWAEQDLAVAPNDWLEESFCVSIAEAMAHSRPAIVTAGGALPELVEPGVTGAVVPPADIDALASAIGDYSRSRQLLSNHGAAARERAERQFNLEVCARRYLDLLEQLRHRGSRARSRR